MKPNNTLEVTTPALLLDRKVMNTNLDRMAKKVEKLGCHLRPHVKTHKSRDVLADVYATGRCSGITVSTLREAAYFFEGGETDILYAVGIIPAKVSLVAELLRQGCKLTCIVDDLDAIGSLSAEANREGIEIDLLIEVDVDGHRSGVKPDSEDLLQIAGAIVGSQSLNLSGVMTHAGGSYGCETLEQLREHAALERDLTVLAATRIRDAGFECSTVSIGSTPTAMMTNDLTGITEIRPGVYTFLDLYQAGLGIAEHKDIALSVLCTVIGHQRDKGWVIVDAGWMAMSRDRGTAGQRIDQGYGVVCDVSGEPLDGVIMGGANQEHGILMARDDCPSLNVAKFPIGSMWRILPNHACATAAQFDRYHVIEDGIKTNEWARISGWG